MRRNGSVKSLLVLGIFAVCALGLLLMRGAIIDQITVFQYQPTADIEKFVSRTGMTDRGKFLFYTGTPQISDREQFNSVCGNHDDSTAVLGCYTGGKIYVYNITEPRLDGIRSVTAAHEMLHAAYDRLPDVERQKVDKLVEEEYKVLQKDRDLAERMKVYAKTEPGQRNNELHSLLGTEIKNLSPALEEYYTQYFKDRAKVVDLYNSYRSVFDDLEAKADSLNKTLTSLQSEITSRRDKYSADIKQLDNDISSFNNRARNGDFSSEAAFESERSAILARSSSLTAEMRQINDLIDQFNAANSQLADIANQTKALDRSINSSLPAVPRL